MIEKVFMFFGFTIIVIGYGLWVFLNKKSKIYYV